MYVEFMKLQTECCDQLAKYQSALKGDNMQISAV